MVSWDFCIHFGRYISTVSVNILLMEVAMLEVVENEFFGLQYERRRTAGRKQSVLSTLVIMMSIKLLF